MVNIFAQLPVSNNIAELPGLGRDGDVKSKRQISSLKMLHITGGSGV